MNACSWLPWLQHTGTFQPQEENQHAGQVKISAALFSPGSCGLGEGSCELRGVWCQRHSLGIQGLLQTVLKAA